MTTSPFYTSCLEQVRAFETQQHTPATWTHEAHLIVGLHYVSRFSQEVALQLLRQKIRALNESMGIPNSRTRGYHETITRFYVWLLVEWAAKQGRHLSEEATLHKLLASPCASKEAPLLYYSRKLLFHPVARYCGVHPDLRPLDFKLFYPEFE